LDTDSNKDWEKQRWWRLANMKQLVNNHFSTFCLPEKEEKKKKKTELSATTIPVGPYLAIPLNNLKKFTTAQLEW